MAEAIKKIASTVSPINEDHTDNDPKDPGQAFLEHIYSEGKTPNKDDYKFARRISNNKLGKFILGLVLLNLGFWIYMILDFVGEFVGL